MLTAMYSECDKPLADQVSGIECVALPRWKRVLDIMFSLAAMPLLALVALRTWIMVKFASPGPVFFRQECVGYRGRRFMCYKFRTMHGGRSGRIRGAKSNAVVHSSTALIKTNIYLPGGRLMRALRLHELPQIINVLRGEMSLVGPRPCFAAEYEKHFSEQTPRFNPVPGLWQVFGGRGIRSCESAPGGASASRQRDPDDLRETPLDASSGPVGRETKQHGASTNASTRLLGPTRPIRTRRR